MALVDIRNIASAFLSTSLGVRRMLKSCTNDSTENETQVLWRAFVAEIWQYFVRDKRQQL
jgi:hypothetical protein